MATYLCKRVSLNEEGQLFLAEGEYGKKDGVWYLRLKGYHTGSLEKHEVVEHEDGTISVTPSILHHEPPKPETHGYLTRGVWKDC